MMRRILTAGACVVLLAACEKTTGPSNLAGTLIFIFTGGGGGTFSTSGIPPANPEIPGTTNWAAAFQDPAASQTGLAGIRIDTGATYDAVILGLRRLTVGSAAVDADCDPNQSDCTGLLFVINGAGPDVATFEFLCVLLSGTFTITEVSTRRAKGTFSGSGECTNQALAVSAFSVSDGSFDVPLIPEPQ
ncbi:MAG: hypothetical protein ACRENU_17705 [Gemmatimonadaceae bacterium]